MADGDLPGAGTDTPNNPADGTASGDTGAAATNGNHGHTTPPDWILDEVKLLLDKMASPETATNAGLTARGDPGAIEDSISPPEPTWTWDDNQARIGQIVYDFDVGKYGVQSDIHKLLKLTSIDPPVWQLVRDFSVATWVWRNQDERDSEVPLDADVGKVCYQADIDTYFQLTKATPAAWKEVSSPQATSAPLSLSTGASDADSFHDFYRLQIAFEDVWAELIDKKAEITAQEFYANWDALVTKGKPLTSTTNNIARSSVK